MKIELTVEELKQLLQCNESSQPTKTLTSEEIKMKIPEWSVRTDLIKLKEMEAK